jgi:hypothetical protein
MQLPSGSCFVGIVIPCLNEEEPKVAFTDGMAELARL